METARNLAYCKFSRFTHGIVHKSHSEGAIFKGVIHESLQHFSRTGLSLDRIYTTNQRILHNVDTVNICLLAPSCITDFLGKFLGKTLY